MSRIVLGIDPGSRRAGYGVIRHDGQRASYLASGVINLGTGSLHDRLARLYTSMVELLEQYTPDEMAIEEVFVAKNPRSALTLGQARGVIMAAGLSHELKISEYAARRVKQAVVGTGRANKEQVQHMVQVLLELSGKPQTDAADALAIALCHVNTAHV